MKNPALLKSFGEHLRMLRKQQGMSLQALADEAEVGWATVQRIEAGNQSATIEVLEALASALRMHLKELMDFSYSSQREGA